MLREGDLEVFRRYFFQYNRRVYSYVIQYLKSCELAEEVVQETFIRLWDSRESIQSNVKGFLFVTARNLTLNMIRNNKQRMLNRIRFELHEKENRSSEEVPMTDAHTKKLLKLAIDNLPEGKREIFRMKTEQGLSNEEIAFALSLTINTVKSQYYHASRLIREYFAERNKTRTG